MVRGTLPQGDRRDPCPADQRDAVLNHLLRRVVLEDATAQLIQGRRRGDPETGLQAGLHRGARIGLPEEPQPALRELVGHDVPLETQNVAEVLSRDLHRGLPTLCAASRIRKDRRPSTTMLVPGRA